MNKLPQGQDFDMKISPDSFAQTDKEAEKASEAQIDFFLQQRDLGNMEKAQGLGDRFFEVLLKLERIKAPGHVDKAALDHQLQLLYCYVVHRITQEMSPNSIVAQKTLSSFYERLAQTEPALFRAMNGNMSFSMYLSRTGEETPESIGRVFAQLCGIPDSKVCRGIGASSYQKFVEICGKMIVDTPYIL